jgi:fatty acid synthase
VFASDKAEEAFRFMAQGKHMGKVLLKMRDEEPEKRVMPKPLKVRAVCRTLCNPEHSYLVTGGLGGFGLELTQWLVSRGARKIVLSSRSGVRTGYQARCLLHWRRSGANVVVSNLNIGHEDQCEKLIKQCQELGPLGGVFHLAMVLRDCLFENQTTKNFKEAAEAKYIGCKNLDSVTRKLCGPELRWFAVWSSISCGRGNSGQTNYGWANSTMERVVEKRQADGLPGLAIRWGAIGDVGVVLENMGDNNTVVGGTLPQRIPSCLQALDSFLSWNHPLVSSFVRAELDSSKKSKHGDPVQAIAHILGVSDVDQLDADASFGDLGLDSLMGVEIKQALERDYDIVLSMKDIRAMTVNKLREMAKSGGGAAAAAIAKEAKKKDQPAEAVRRTVDDDSDDEEDEQDSLQSLMSIFRLRVDLSALRPDKVIVQLNKVTEGRPVFCVPSIEGVGAPLATLAAKIPFPVYSVQAIQAAPQDNIEQLALFYAQEIRKVQPEGPYRIIGYSYGACVGLELATGLQEQKPGSVESLILLDGSHRYMQAYRKAWRTAYGVGDGVGFSDDYAVIFETEVLCAFVMRIVPVDYEQLRKELFALPNYRARANVVVQKVMSSGLPVKAADVEFAAESLCKKIAAADKYDPKKKFKGDITLIRAEIGTAREEDVGKDYHLHEVTDSQVHVHVVSGDHDTFVQGKSSDTTASIITAILNGHKDGNA